MTLTQPDVRTLRRAAELLAEQGEPTELRRERDALAAELLRLAQAACSHRHVFRGICSECLGNVAAQAQRPLTPRAMTASPRYACPSENAATGLLGAATHGFDAVRGEVLP